LARGPIREGFAVPLFPEMLPSRGSARPRIHECFTWHPARNASAGMLTRITASTVLTTGAVLVLAAITAPAAHAQVAPQQQLCDPEYQDCRAALLSYIAQETVEIDMGFWLMNDAEYSNALVAAWRRGVKIRLLMDLRCTTEHPACAGVNSQLSQAGLPMRRSIEGGILHWKVAIFAG